MMTADVIGPAQGGKSTGHISRISLDITAPIPMKGQDIEFKSVSLFCGKNGSGKTFIMVACFAMSVVEAAIVAGLIGDPLKEVTQYTFDNCYNDQNIDGVLGMESESGSYVNISFTKGKVVDVAFANFHDIVIATPVTFMSSAMRTFDAIGSYVKMRNMIYPGKSMSMNDIEKVTAAMLKAYKLYDVMYVEGLIMKMPLKLNPTLTQALEQFQFEPGIKEIGLDYDKGDFYTEGDKGRKYMTTYGKGHQSILNMLIGSSN